jgi:glycosyltransferase involved in cell wall biosynthesis
VEDVRPYLQHAAAVVAPLRVARGIQNKILEAMAMGQPVITVPSCAEPIGATAEQGLWRCDEAECFAQGVLAWLADPARRERLGAAAREHVVQNFSWQANLDRLAAWLPTTESS